MNPNDYEMDVAQPKDSNDSEEFVPGPQDPASEADDSDDAFDDDEDENADEDEDADTPELA